MSTHCIVQLRLHNQPGVLPRILLAFSRRRLRVRALHFLDVDAGDRAELQIDFEATPDRAEEVAAVIRRVIEVSHLWLEIGEATAPARSPTPEQVAAPNRAPEPEPAAELDPAGLVAAMPA
jgi:acetolactate synthase regulatory subunit